MTYEQIAVREFHHKFGLVVNHEPHLEPYGRAYELRKLRASLIREEAEEVVRELEVGAIGNPASETLSRIAKELADLLYVTYGTAVSLGIDLQPVFAEVHRSNMTKMNPDGSVSRRADGKILKPATYTPPDIESVLERQRIEGDPA